MQKFLEKQLARKSALLLLTAVKLLPRVCVEITSAISRGFPLQAIVASTRGKGRLKCVNCFPMHHFCLFSENLCEIVSIEDRGRAADGKKPFHRLTAKTYGTKDPE